MAGFSSLSDLVSETTVNSKILECSFYKVGTAPEANGSWHSLWSGAGYPAAGGNGAAGSGTPGAGGTALSLADGSLVKWANATGGDTKHLLHFGAVASQDCTLMLYDRLVSVALGAITSTGSKNVGSAALPRYTDGIGVEVWAEVTTVTATAAPIMHLLTYTDQDGNTGQVGAANITFPAVASNVDSFVGPFPLAAGDTGVKSVETVNVDTASGGSGAVNIVLIKPLAYLPLLANNWGEREFLTMLPSLPRLYDGHTLGIAMLAQGTTATNVWGILRAAYG